MHKRRADVICERIDDSDRDLIFTGMQKPADIEGEWLNDELPEIRFVHSNLCRVLDFSEIQNNPIRTLEIIRRNSENG